MLLIADSGSTKCDWVLMDLSGKTLLKTSTRGLNPLAINNENILLRLKENPNLKTLKNQVAKIHFYGAGCATETPKKRMQSSLKSFFPKAQEIGVFEDMIAAVYAVTTQPGIVCILGTGSNSCYFDGKKITSKIPSMGFILMDEASGNYFGKRLLRDYYYKEMPMEIAKEFQSSFDLSPDVVKENLYNRENPRSYLGNFAEFALNNKHVSYCRQVLEEGISNFLDHHVTCYEEVKNLPVHFVGSIAFYAQDIVSEMIKSYGFEMGNVVQRPVDGLVEYYREKLKC